MSFLFVFSLFFIATTFFVASNQEVLIISADKEKVEKQIENLVTTVSANETLIIDNTKQVLDYVMYVTDAKPSFFQNEIDRPLLSDELKSSVKNYTIYRRGLYTSLDSNAVTQHLELIGLNTVVSVELTWSNGTVIYIRVSSKDQ